MKLYKRGSTWWADLRAEGMDRVSTRCTDKVEARKAAKRLIEGGAAGKRMRDALVKAWDEHYKGTKGARNAESIHHQLLESTGSDPLDRAASTPYLKRLVQDLKAAGNTGATINRKLAHLSKVFKLACEWGWLDSLPHVPRQKEGAARHRELSTDEYVELMRLLKPEFKDLMTFLLDTGARLSEALKLDELDRMRAMSTEVWLIRDTKSGKDRAVPLTSRARACLSHWSWEGLTPRQCQREWDRVRELMGLKDDPGFVIHCLRHTCASRLVQGGMPLERVQLWLGHGTIAVTQRYAHLNVDQLMDGVAVLESALENVAKR